MNLKFLFSVSAFLPLLNLVAGAKHIVVFKPHQAPLDILGNVDRWFEFDAVRGFVADVSTKDLEWLARHPSVDYIEKDSTVHICKTQENATWGLARVSHGHDVPNDHRRTYHYDATGKGTSVFVIDTGVYVDHEDLEGRARWGITIPSGQNDTDGHGHGTHVAGTIASKTYGVAKEAEIVAVKVLDDSGSGWFSDVIMGIEWVTKEYKKHLEDGTATEKKRYVINMSLGGSKMRALDMACNAAVDAGVVVVVAAGNDYGQDACMYSPAGADKVITVAASNSMDEVAYFSNLGPCVDVFAPGYNVKSIYKDSPNATSVMSGTSMASPHVAGVVALYLSMEQYKEYGPVQVLQLLHESATKDVFRDKLSDNRTRDELVFNLASEKRGIAKDLSQIVLL